MATWRKMLEEVRLCNEDKSELIIHPLDLDLDRNFDDGFGGTEGHPFTAWSDNWVYFPVCYDGAEWVGSVPRNPCEIATEHKGGG